MFWDNGEGVGRWDKRVCLEVKVWRHTQRGGRRKMKTPELCHPPPPLLSTDHATSSEVIDHRLYELGGGFNPLNLISITLTSVRLLCKFLVSKLSQQAWRIKELTLNILRWINKYSGHYRNLVEMLGRWGQACRHATQVQHAIVSSFSERCHLTVGFHCGRHHLLLLLCCCVFSVQSFVL